MQDTKTLLAAALIGFVTAMMTAASGLAGEGATDGVSFPPSYQSGEFKISLFGRINQDFTWADADKSDIDFYGDELRRLRLGVKGDFTDEWSYKLEANFGGDGDVTVADAFIAWHAASAPFVVQAGQQFTPNSLDNLTSSRFGSTLERAGFVNAFGLNRRVGVVLYDYGKRYTLAGGIFGDALENEPLGGSYAAAARVTYNPILGENTIVHLGASMRFRNQSNDASLIRYKQRPFAHQLGGVLSTERFADKDAFYGAEAAAIYKNFWMAAEYGGLSANCADCGGDPWFDGYYVESGFFIGGARSYKKGRFNRPAVFRSVGRGGLGAASLVFRFDHLDLSGTGVNGGALNTYVAGAEWWPVKNAKIALNYFHANADFGDITSGIWSVFADQISDGVAHDDVDGVTLRLQLDL